MNIIVTDTYEDMSRKAADIIAAHIKENPACVLGLATGSTPIGLYANLVDKCAKGLITFANVTTFNLDEYRGLTADNTQSYRYFMQHHLFDHVDIDICNTHVPDGVALDVDAACAAYEQAIQKAGGIDVQLLGLGHNGHIGFNEPSESFPLATHRVKLTQSTIQANSRLFLSADEVPREAYTMGIGTIMAAKEILVVASGSDKAAIVRDASSGPVTPFVPASVLQFHPRVTLVLDKDAASCLK